MAVTRRAKVPQSAPGDAKRTSILQNTAKLSAVIQNTAKWREILHKSATQAAYIYDAKMETAILMENNEPITTAF